MVQLIMLPEEQFFLTVEGKSKRVMINTSDIKAVEFSTGNDLVLSIKTWNEEYIFTGSDASEIEDFLFSFSRGM